MHIKVTWGTDVGTVPKDFKAEINKGVSFLDKLFTNNVTINLTVAFSDKVKGAESLTDFPKDKDGKYISYSYADIRGALNKITEQTTIQKAAYGTLPEPIPRAALISTSPRQMRRPSGWQRS